MSIQIKGKKLHQTLNFYKTLLRVSNDGILITDPYQNIIEVNDAFCSYIGQKRNDVLESNLMTWLEAFKGDSVKNWRTLETETQSKQKSNNFEFQFILNNKLKYFSVNASLLEKVDTVEQDIIISNWHDITKMKELEKSFKYEHDKINSVLSDLPIGVSVLDANHKLVYINPISQKFDGYPKNLQRTLNDYVTKVHPKKIQKKVEKLLKDFKSGDKSMFTREAKRGNRAVEISYYATRNSEEKYTGLVRLITDITSRKNSEAALKESEKRYRLLAENSTDTIWLMNNDGTFIYHSPAVMNLRGYTPEEANNISMEKTMTPQSMVFLAKIFAQEEAKPMKKRWDSLRFELEMFQKDGTKIWTEVSAKGVFDNKNQMIGIQGATHNITDRKKIEEALKKSEEKVRNIFENSTIVHYSHNLNHVVTYVSPQVENILGYTPKEVKINWTTLASDNPLNKIGFRSTVKAIETGERQPTYELELVHKNGKRVSLEVYEAPIVRNGKTIAIVGSFSDITKRKQIERDLQEAHEKLKISIDNMSNAYILTDTDFIITEWNLTAEMIFGYSKNDVLGKNFINLVVPKKVRHLVKEVMKKLKVGEVSNYSEKNNNVRKDGKLISCQWHNTPLVDKNGKVFSILYMAQDITEKMLSEEALRDSEARYARIERGTNDGFWDWNVLTNEDYLSPRWKELLGFKEDELKNHYDTFFSRLHPDDLHSAQTALKAHFEQNIPYNLELRLRTKNGEYKWFSVRGMAERDEQGRAVLMSGSITDITERKKNEMELKAAKEKAEESDRLKSAFLANMSHEIRTPMNGILGFTDLLKEPKLSGEKQEKYISIIENSGNRLLKTVNNLINISKIESGQMKISMSDINITKLLNQLFIFFIVEAQNKGLQLSLNRTCLNKNIILLSDQEKVYSILTNLIKNAIKYSQSGTIDFGIQEKENELQFFVKDTGDGIPKERLEVIFDRFIRNTLHEDGAIEGSGLGLSISKAYVEMLGGKIWVNSEENVGSQFYFTIPYKSVNAETDIHKEVDAVTKSEPPIRGLKILIAEDDETAYNLLSILIENCSKEILHAKSGFEAVELCRSNPDIDLVLMDIQMPEMNGYKATKLIREFNKDVIIIAQTAFALVGDREKAIKAGCNDYLTKPIHKDTLKEKLKKFINYCI